MADVVLKLTIGSFSVEVAGPAEYADKKLEDLLSRYLTTSKLTPPGETTAATPLDVAAKGTSPGEFLKKTGHKNQVDRALALGYYLERMKSQPSFSTGELGELGKVTKHPFTNISDIVGKLVGRGLMMSAGEKDNQRAYALTASGEEFVESMTVSK